MISRLNPDERHHNALLKRLSSLFKSWICCWIVLQNMGIRIKQQFAGKNDSVAKSLQSVI
jgi:hypothetical protein